MVDSQQATFSSPPIVNKGINRTKSATKSGDSVEESGAADGLSGNSKKSRNSMRDLTFNRPKKKIEAVQDFSESEDKHKEGILSLHSIPEDGWATSSISTPVTAFEDLRNDGLDAPINPTGDINRTSTILQELDSSCMDEQEEEYVAALTSAMLTFTQTASDDYDVSREQEYNFAMVRTMLCLSPPEVLKGMRQAVGGEYIDPDEAADLLNLTRTMAKLSASAAGRTMSNIAVPVLSAFVDFALASHKEAKTASTGWELAKQDAAAVVMCDFMKALATCGALYEVVAHDQALEAPRYIGNASREELSELVETYKEGEADAKADLYRDVELPEHRVINVRSLAAFLGVAVRVRATGPLKVAKPFGDFTGDLEEFAHHSIEDADIVHERQEEAEHMAPHVPSGGTASILEVSSEIPKGIPETIVDDAHDADISIVDGEGDKDNLDQEEKGKATTLKPPAPPPPPPPPPPPQSRPPTSPPPRPPPRPPTSPPAPSAAVVAASPPPQKTWGMAGSRQNRNGPKKKWTPAVPTAAQAASLPLPPSAFPKRRGTLYGPFLCGPIVQRERTASVALQNAREAFEGGKGSAHGEGTGRR